MANLSAVDLFLAILIGMGPIKALLAFIEATQGASEEIRQAMAKKAALTVAIVALILLVLGALFMRLLHFSTGALTVAGGLILLLLGVHMVLSAPTPPAADEVPLSAQSLLSKASFPIAIPLTLNPIGIVVLTTVSAEAQSPLAIAIVAAMALVVAAFDYAVFMASGKLEPYLTRERILIAEKLLGILLAALAVQLILNGLSDVGVITLGEAGQQEH